MYKQPNRTTIKIFRLFVTAALLAVLAGSLLVRVFTVHAREIPFPTEHNLVSDFRSARDACAADLDNDGDLDLIGVAYYGTATGGNHVRWWKNDGSGGFTMYIVADLTAALSVYAADIDGDGFMDIVAGAAAGSHQVAWWQNDGSPADGGWTKTIVASSFNGADVFAADLDGDGDLDILGADDSGDQVIWWENGNSWAAHTIATGFNGANSVYAADLDNDGDLDVVGAARDAYNQTCIPHF